MWPILSWLTGGIIDSAGKAVTDVGKTFWGSQEERDSALSAEQLAVLNQYAAEFATRAQRTWWDSFVDGLNRIVRPGLAIGAQAAFFWSAYDPETFSETMIALQAVPEMMWYLWLAIFGFYFGGRIIETMPKTWKIEPKTLDIVKEVVASRAARAASKDAADVVKDATAQAVEVVKSATAQAADVVKVATAQAAGVANGTVEPAVVAEPAPVEVAGRYDNSQDDIHAVAATIWGEARSEPLAGQIAVGFVIRNRVNNPGWWGSGYRGVCLAAHQFSCWWDVQGARVRYVDKSDTNFVNCLDIAEDIIGGKYSDPTNGADHYYADTISAPKWAQGHKATIVIGHHIFYRLGLDGKG